MSNGRACCILGVCCPPPQQEDALARHLQNEYEKVQGGKSYAYMQIAAKLILRDFDIVPKGVGSTIISRYRKAFEEDT